MTTVASRQVGEFVLDQPIGATSSATVYRAFQPTINRYVALKLIELPASAPTEDPAYFERRFSQEAQVLVSLEHPHIVPIYHFGFVPDECAYLAMRLMYGSLADLRHKFPLPPEQVVDITLQLLEGLSYAHKQGVIHRDLKPENILFDEAGSACLTDFGLTRISARSLLPSHGAAIAASAAFLAPEQIRRDTTDPRSDIYSVGAVMYEMLTGQLPVDAQELNIVSYLQKIEVEENIPPRRLNGNIPPELDRIVLRALRKEPRERFFEIQEMMDALEHLPGTRLRLPHARRALPERRRVDNRRILTPRYYLFGGAAVLLIAVLLLAAAILLFDQNRPMQEATVTVGERGAVEDIIPSAAEIAQAQRRLGSQGFIAYIACALSTQFQATSAREMGDFAGSYGLAFRVYNSSNDAYRQLTLIEQARLEGARAIILCPLKPELLSESLMSIQSARLPLVLTNWLANSYGGVMIDTNDEVIGRLAGDFTADALTAETAGHVNVVILDAPNYAYSEARVQGYLEGLSAYSGTIEIVGRFPTATEQVASQAAIAELLGSSETIDAIFSVVDTGAYGASTALANAGIPPDAIVLTSINAESLALSDIYNGNYLRASIDIARENGARSAVNAVVKLLGGGTIPETISLPTGNIITRDIMNDLSS